jgi:indole-3-glycerol phosphate synthase
MAGILQRIVERKRAEVGEAMRLLTARRLQETVATLPPCRPFRGALVEPGSAGVNVIAEFKRASPSRGPIRRDADPAAIAAGYASAGAAALSVLTDRDFFQGSPDDLRQARTATALPVLRKDFVVSDYQLLEARAMGADAVLLIARILSPSQLGDYLLRSAELGLAALVEVHNEAELDAATVAGACLVGINSRDLDTFRTDLAVVERLATRLAPGQTGVAESGIRTAGDLARLRAAGIHNFLVGETLMTAPDPGTALGRLLMEFADLSQPCLAPAQSGARIR